MVVCADFGREIARVSIENRAILREFGRDFGAQAARIDRKTCAIIAGSRWTSWKVNAHENLKRAVCFARKIHELFEENCMRLGRFLQSFGVRQARRECATHAEVVFDVLQMIWGISEALECKLRLFARSFGAEVRRFRSKIARFCV